RRDVRDGRAFDRRVTVAAVEPQFSRVKLVAIGDGLNGAITHVGELRRPVIPDARDRGGGHEQTEGRGEQRELVQPAWKELRQARLSSLVVHENALHERSPESKRRPQEGSRLK